jgi:hypothetical protein
VRFGTCSGRSPLGGLGRRLEQHSGDSYSIDCTGGVLASVIVADLRIQNVENFLADLKISQSEVKTPETTELKAEAEEFKKKGNGALARKEYERVIELHTETVKIDTSIAVCRGNISTASFALDHFHDSLEDAYIATRFNPMYTKACSR